MSLNRHLQGEPIFFEVPSIRCATKRLQCLALRKICTTPIGSFDKPLARVIMAKHVVSCGGVNVASSIYHSNSSRYSLVMRNLSRQLVGSGLILALSFSAQPGFSRFNKESIGSEEKSSPRLTMSTGEGLADFRVSQITTLDTGLVLGNRIQEIEREINDENGATKRIELEMIIARLVSNQSEEAKDMLGLILVKPTEMPYSYEILINSLSRENPSQLFQLAQRAVLLQPVPTTPTALFKPAIISEVFKSMSQRDQEMLAQGDRSQQLRLNAIAALSYAPYDATNELVMSMPSSILFAAVIDIYSQTEALWCANNLNRSNKIVTFSNKITKLLAPQFLPKLEAAAKKDPDPASTPSQALSSIKGAIAENNLDQQCGGCCGSWGMIFDGIFNILKPTQ
jgi:hypothetical protein